MGKFASIIEKANTYGGLRPKVTKLPNGGKRLEHDRAIWYIDKEGRLHREDGPAMISKLSKLEQWFIRGKFHRDDGPAHIDNFVEVWYKFGKEHRIGGPAVIYKHGEVMYYVNGNEMTEEEFNKHFGDDK